MNARKRGALCLFIGHTFIGVLIVQILLLPIQHLQFICNIL